MKLLIYGKNGWIASQFAEYLRTQNVDFVFGESRVDNIENLKNEISKNSPTHIFSFIGRTSGVYKDTVYNTIDYLEQPGTLQYNVRDNLFSPIVLAMICKEQSIHFTYLGTGCIFDYDSTGHQWNENDTPNFFGSGYSIVKGFTDRLMHLFNNTALNLRIRMPITNDNHKKNFITKITQYERICSIPNSMTVLADFFPVWLDMIVNSKTGTYNCTNPGVISHNEILEMYKHIVDASFTWTNFTIEEQNKILDSKRSNNHLDTTRLETEYPTVPNIKDSVKKVFESWIKN